MFYEVGDILMKKEISSGAVVYEIFDDSVKFLIVKHKLGHFSFPKGHIEDRESEIDAAVREVSEETGILINIDLNFKRVNTYCPSKNIVKDVIYFVGNKVSGYIKAQETEISNVFWFDYTQARDILTYESDKKILDDAYKYIINKFNC